MHNPTLIRLWKGNMDIQPCGFNDAIAYHTAKNISKSELVDLDRDLAEAFGNLWKNKCTDSWQIHETRITASQSQLEKVKKQINVCTWVAKNRNVRMCRMYCRGSAIGAYLMLSLLTLQRMIDNVCSLAPSHGRRRLQDGYAEIYTMVPFPQTDHAASQTIMWATLFKKAYRRINQGQSTC